MHEPECPKCRSSMTAGFIVDKGYGAARVSPWQEGEPKTSFWTGVQESKRDQLSITTWRCTRCGYLESYALDA